MIQCKFSDIKEVLSWYARFKDDLNDNGKNLIGSQPSVYEYAYYTPSQANWSYRLGIVTINGEAFKVVIRFGEIIACMYANIYNYTTDEIKQRKF